ncbi:MAG TPA: helix-turn-helix domain-containing protein [Kofleriaceae bacterium]|nr:helix-turn-helix domain-containing protein [Kofleriaceae bacterium]
MKNTRALAGLPPEVRTALAKLGADLSLARRRRRISVQAMAERTFTSRATIARVERGDPRVSMAIYASVLFVVGMIENLLDIAEPSLDEQAGELDVARIPLRVRGRARR